MLAFSRRWGALALLAAFLIATPARSQGQGVPPFDRDAPPGDPPSVPGQPEVDGRGPIHEGFAQPNGAAPKAGPTAPKLPPELIDERPPEVKPDGPVIWVPGYWGYDEDRRDFVWVSGFWRLPPAGRKWVPGYWVRTADGARWVSGFWAPATATEVPYYDAPPDSLDVGPSIPPPDDSYFYVPGTWAPFDGRWRWRAGFWCAPRVGLVYTPARTLWTPRGYVHVGAFWDRPWAGRGLPFAPVYFNGSPWTQPGWFFRPSYGLNVSVALGSLWVRPGWGSYAFGDYYGATYARRGYQPWATWAPRARDPLFSYYRATSPTWQRDQLATFRDRTAGRATLPPRTLAAQGRAPAALRAVQPVATFRSDSFRMTKVTTTERRETERLARAYREASTARRTEEARRLPSGTRPAPLALTRVPTPPAVKSARTEAPRVLSTTPTAPLRRPETTAPRLRAPEAPRITTTPPRRTEPAPRLTPPRVTTPPPTTAPRARPAPRPEAPRATPPPRLTTPPKATTPPPTTAPRVRPAPRPEAPRVAPPPRITTTPPRDVRPRVEYRSAPPPRLTAPPSAPRMSSPPRSAPPPRRSAPPPRSGRPDKGR